MKTYYTRWIEVYQNIPNLDETTTSVADAKADIFEQELASFVGDFNKKHGTEFDVGEFESKFEEIEEDEG